MKKNILIGITGSIAAYKIPYLIRIFKKNNYNVKTIMTKNALNFITPLVLKTLTDNPVYIEEFNSTYHDIEHINLIDWADVLLVAPATANIIGKAASGIADDLLSSTIVTALPQIPIIFAPAMNTNMYNNQIVQENINKLKKFGIEFVEPESGELACKAIGKGRLADLEYIFFTTVKKISSGELKNKKVLIIAGKTIEAIDPVRYISNFSSGKMGFYIAKEAIKRGADVTIIKGKTDIDYSKLPSKIINIQSALDIKNDVLKFFDNTDILISVAAISDYRPEKIMEHKIKKTNSSLSIKLIQNPDILKLVSSHKTHQLLVGFSLETNNELDNAKEKLKRKNLDIIILNNPLKKGSLFGSDFNKITIIDKYNNIDELPILTKEECSKKIFDKIINFMEHK